MELTRGFLSCDRCKRSVPFIDTSNTTRPQHRCGRDVVDFSAFTEHDPYRIIMSKDQRMNWDGSIS